MDMPIAIVTIRIPDIIITQVDITKEYMFTDS